MACYNKFGFNLIELGKYVIESHSVSMYVTRADWVQNLKVYYWLNFNYTKTINKKFGNIGWSIKIVNQKLPFFGCKCNNNLSKYE